MSFPFSSSELLSRFGDSIYPESLTVLDGFALWLQRSSAEEQPGAGKTLALLASPGNPALSTFHGRSQEFEKGYTLRLCPADLENSKNLTTLLPGLKPVPLGMATSLGTGDRLGQATPGHVRALRSALAEAPGKEILPIFAQQSIRENARTGRTPEVVLCDATWGAFQEGWRGPVGADADHLKTVADLDLCAAAGYSLFTIDPGEYVDGSADAASEREIAEKLPGLPWEFLDSSMQDLESRYAVKAFDLGERKLSISREDILRSAVKYGEAIAHVTRLSRHLDGKAITYELEVSVDETATPTRPAEHYYIASELKRLGVRWVSLAPRFVGRFEKGVDYIGDLKALEDDLNRHAQIARCLGPYKLSLHSGSDKFSVYPLIARAARGSVHLKTAGTSYLEALRVLSAGDPASFREILVFARQRYPVDRASYHVSAEVEKVPQPERLSDSQLPGLLEDFDARQVLHVTFGSVMDRYGTGIRSFLNGNEELYYAALERHFQRHLKPFVNVD